jgi:hypothetical protein
MKKSATRPLPKAGKVQQAIEHKGAHAACVWQQLRNESGVILKPGKK